MAPALERPLRVSAAPVVALVVSLLHGCGGGSGGGDGLSGTYTSVQTAEIQADFDSDGTVVFSMGGERGEPARYTVDGEKIVVEVDGRQMTFLRDGDCIEDLQNVFGKLCKGGPAGAAANVSTRTPAPTAGTWTATNADGTFTLAFGAGNRLTFAVTPAAGSQMGDQARTSDGTFELEGDTLYAQPPTAPRWC